MRKLIVFESVSVDGYFVDNGGDMSWAHNPDAEFDAFTSENAKGCGTLVFGRITYELMAGWWPTSEAARMAPEVAAAMNRLPKVVFSRKLEKADWSNTRLIKSDPVAAIRALKAEEGKDLVIMGSGSLVALLAPTSLIDEYQLVLVPVALGGGRTLFQGIGGRLPLTLAESRRFKNGNVFLRYV